MANPGWAIARTSAPWRHPWSSALMEHQKGILLRGKQIRDRLCPILIHAQAGIVISIVTFKAIHPGLIPSQSPLE